MEKTTRVIVLKEVTQPVSKGLDLAFQKVIYKYGDGTLEEGFRFMRKKDGKLLAQRGQANVVSLKMVKHMIANFERANPYE